MGLPLFWLFVLAACLLWSATFSAAAARSARFPSLLSLAAWLVPVLVLAPAVGLTGLFAFCPKPFDVKHLAAAVALLVAAFIGGLWITIAGWQRAVDGLPVARRWPVIGLAGLCGMAVMVAYGTLVAIDNAVTAEAVQRHFEAAALMQANLLPAVADADNAARLHRHVAALLAGDDTFRRKQVFDVPDDAIDIRSPEVGTLLARHADTLDLIRRAADRNACRFDRDWRRPWSIDLEDMEALRDEARLLALAARRAAADGNAAAALADTVRIHRIARHAAAESAYIASHMEPLELDSLARDTLTRVLPSLEADDLTLLDTPGLDGVIGPPPPPLRAMLGEETQGLSLFADVATGRMTIAGYPGDTIAGLIADRFGLYGLVYRTLFLRDDLSAYRDMMREYQWVCARDEVSISNIKRVRRTHDVAARRGLLCEQFEPSVEWVQWDQLQATAGARAARSLLAATKHRLTAGTLPKSLSDLVPDQLSAVPRDPYTDNNQPLRSKLVDGGMLVWSVGPDGADDGGPTGRNTFSEDMKTGNDDFGLWLVPDRPSATPIETATE
jgi:hypothetical protein